MPPRRSATCSRCTTWPTPPARSPPTAAVRRPQQPARLHLLPRVVSSAASPSAAGAIFSGLAILNNLSSNASSLRNTLQHVLSSPPVTKAIQTALHNPQILQAVEQIASHFNAHDDALDGLLKDLASSRSRQ